MPNLRITLTNASRQMLEFSGIRDTFPGNVIVSNRNGRVMLRDTRTHAALSGDLVLDWEWVSLAPRGSKIYTQPLSRKITDTRLGKEFKTLDEQVLEPGSTIVCQIGTKSGVVNSSPLRLP